MLEERGPILDRKRPAVKIKPCVWYDFLNMRTIAATLVLSLVVCFAAAAGVASIGQASKGPGQKRTANLAATERALMSSSRQAIVATGISESYFDRHFSLVKVVNQPGDRRIVWTFSLNDFRATVTDVLGYYTQNGKRIDTHGVTTTLGKTSDIAATISQRRANQIMQRCIGIFTHPTVEYRAINSTGARLVLAAEAVRKLSPDDEKRERERHGAAKPKPAQGEVSEGGDEGGAPIIIGTVDLQTGACTKGQLVVAP